MGRKDEGMGRQQRRRSVVDSSSEWVGVGGSWLSPFPSPSSFFLLLSIFYSLNQSRALSLSLYHSASLCESLSLSVRLLLAFSFSLGSPPFPSFGACVAMVV